MKREIKKLKFRKSKGKDVWIAHVPVEGIFAAHYEIKIDDKQKSSKKGEHYFYVVRNERRYEEHGYSFETTLPPRNPVTLDHAKENAQNHYEAIAWV